MSISDFLFESKHNSYDLTSEQSKYAENFILSGIFFLANYFKSTYKIVEKKTYEIQLPSDKIKVASFKTEFLRSDESNCTIEISNPYTYLGIRFWTKFETSSSLFARPKVYWTDKKTLTDLRIDNNVVFFLFANNKDWILNKIKEVNNDRLSGKPIAKNDEIIISPDYSPKFVTEEQKEEAVFNLFKKVFKT